MPRPLVAIALLTLLGLAIAVRFPGLDYLLPGLIEPDAHIMVQVELIERGDPQPSESIDWGKYPHLVAWSTVACTPWRTWGELEPSAPLEDHLALAIAPAVRVRWTVALLSLLMLPATWLLARLYLPSKWSLLAALLATTSLLAVHFATQGRPHGAAAALPALAVVACVQARRRPGWLWTGLAAGACGLAMAGLHSGVAAFLAFGAAHFLGARGRGWRHHLLLLAPLVAFGITLVAFYPFWFEGSEGGRVELKGSTLDQAGHKINLAGFNGKGFGLLARSLWSWEPVLCLGALIALATWLIERGRRRPAAGGLPWADHLVVLAYALPYALVIGLYQRSYERFLLPLVPFLAVWTAIGLWRLASFAGTARPTRVAAALFVSVALAFPTLVVARLAQLRVAPSTFDQAAAWVERELEPGRDRIALNLPLILPLYRTPAALAADFKPRAGRRNMLWIDYQEGVLGEVRSGPAWDISWLPMQRKVWREEIMRSPARFVHSLPEDYCITEIFEAGRIDPVGAAIRRGLDERAEFLARFSPDADPERFDAPLIYQDETGGTIPFMAWRVLGARSMGPVLQVYRLPGRRQG